jgi:hypothetical protein
LAEEGQVAEKFVYYLGLDLGQSSDYTALCVLEEPVWVGPQWKSQVPPFRSGWVSPADIAPSHLRYAIKEARRRGRPPNPPLFVRHLERFSLGTKYTAIVERVRELIETPPLAGKPAVLLVDKTGVGAGVIDQFEHRGIRRRSPGSGIDSASRYRSGTWSRRCRCSCRPGVSRWRLLCRRPRRYARSF